MRADYHSDIIAQAERSVRLTGLPPRVCSRCEHLTLYPIEWCERNGMDANGREVCGLCIMELRLIKLGVINER